MHEQISTNAMETNKKAKYEELLQGLRALIAGEDEAVSVMANVCAAVHEAMGFIWTGFYLWRKDELRLGPFQGSVACMHIAAGRGVCGAALERRETLVVPDVERFPGHIACSSLSRSEIVVPMYAPDGRPLGVLDVDSDRLNTFDATDAHYHGLIAELVAPLL